MDGELAAVAYITKCRSEHIELLSINTLYIV